MAFHVSSRGFSPVLRLLWTKECSFGTGCRDLSRRKFFSASFLRRLRVVTKRLFSTRPSVVSLCHLASSGRSEGIDPGAGILKGTQPSRENVLASQYRSGQGDDAHKPSTFPAATNTSRITRIRCIASRSDFRSRSAIENGIALGTAGLGKRVERRLTAILAADVVGYSRLMGLDEAGTLSALKAHRRELVDGKIAEHQGRIVS
jgi:hypothetical protein